MPIQAKTENYQNSDNTEYYSDQNAQLAGGTLRPSSSRKAPLAKKIPDAHAQVKGRSQHTNDEKCEIPRI
jgi:hypothetical protein